MSKNWKKIFEAKFTFLTFWLSRKLNKKVKVVFRLQSNGKKFATVKFSSQEYALIHQAAVSLGMNDQEFFNYLFKSLSK